MIEKSNSNYHIKDKQNDNTNKNLLESKNKSTFNNNSAQINSKFLNGTYENGNISEFDEYDNTIDEKLNSSPNSNSNSNSNSNMQLYNLNSAKS